MPRGGHGHACALHGVYGQGQGCPYKFGFQRVVGSQQLGRNTVQPGFVPFLDRAQAALVNDLHALFTCCQCKATHAQVALQAGQPVGHQGVRPGQSLGVFQDQRRIHQCGAVVANQCGRLHHWVDLLEFLGGAKHRERLVLKTQTKQLQRHRNAANVWRIEHADKAHGVKPLPAVLLQGASLTDAVRFAHPLFRGGV